MNYLYIALIVVAACFLVWAFTQKKYPIVKYVIYAIVCIVLPISAAYCGNQLNIYYNAEGGVIGYLSGTYDPNKIETVDEMSFAVTDTEFKQVSGDWYNLRITSDKVMKLEANKDYRVHVNDVPCDASEYSTDYILSSYEYNFYDYTKDLMQNDVLSINVAFNANYTELVIETHGGESAVKYWQSYFNKNNFVISIKEVSYVPGNDLDFGQEDADSFCKVEYYVDDALYTTEVYVNGATLKGEDLTREGYVFKGWSTDGVNIISADYTVNADVKLYAVFEKTAGLFTEDGALIASWDSLIDSNYIRVEGTEITYTYSSLEGVLIIEDGITVISDARCEGLTSVKMPDSVTVLGEYAFMGCSNLKEVKLSKNLTSIGKWAFDECSALEKIELPTTLTSIEDAAFYGCSALEKIELPDKLTIIGTSAFRNCSKLKEIIIPDKVHTLGGFAFAGCTSLTTVKLPNNIKSVMYSLFEDCVSLTSIVIPDSVETIYFEAFKGCTSLTSIYIPDSVSVIDLQTGGSSESYSPFYNCSQALVVYCEAGTKPSGWQDYWNYYSIDNQLIVKYGYTYEQYLAEIS